MLDILIKQANIFGEVEQLDIGICHAKVSLKESDIKVNAKEIIDGKDKLVIPGFVDSHTHLEKALLDDHVSNHSGTLQEAIENFKVYFKTVDEENFYERAKKALEKAIVGGTTTLRSHISVSKELKFKAIAPLLELKKDMADYITLEVVAFATPFPDVLDKENLSRLEKALEKGATVLGGCPTLAPNHKEFIDTFFELAIANNCPLDFHVDESDEPNIQALEYLAEKTIKEGYEGKVTAGHCCSLSAVDDDTAMRVILKVKEAGITIVTLPSANLYLMGRNDCQPIRRGITRVRELLDNQVNVAYSSDNLRDPFRPFGNFDMLEEALLMAQVAQMGREIDFENILKMGTYNAAKGMGLVDYGLEVGNTANLVLLDASSAKDAIISQANKSHIIKNGKIVAKNRKTSHLIYNN
ncbi:MAG: hypothetical protein APF76_08475 [Desulfitibacter sp. BRH_c19]|nr:MAG: hypothetical protein APF76_08475 [Desulfitibacter sp. BRH_c19]